MLTFFGFGLSVLSLENQKWRAINKMNSFAAYQFVSISTNSTPKSRMQTSMHAHTYTLVIIQPDICKHTNTQNHSYYSIHNDSIAAAQPLILPIS